MFIARPVIGLLILYAACSTPAAAELRLHAFIGDHMVIQRDRPAVVRGWADPGAAVTVSLEGRTAQAQAGPDGAWEAVLSPLSPGGPHMMTVAAGGDTIRIHDILIGDLWLCSGQSNMEMPVGASAEPIREIAAAYHPRIRLFKAANRVAIEPKDDIEGMWTRCRPSTILGFSGAGYFFGRALHDSLGVPIGLVDASWGGTVAECWMSRESLAANPAFRPILDHWRPLLANPDTALIAYFGRMGDYHDDIYLMINGGQPYEPFIEKPPSTPVTVAWVPPIPSWNYNAMIAPLVPFPIRGVIWYQGESNAGRAYQYRRLFPALIADWRRLWNDETLPFCFAQIASFQKPGSQPVDDPWAELREAQSMTLAVPRTAMAVTIDIGDSTTVHPLNKQEVGRRLALGALHVAYGRDIVYTGPVFESVSVRNGRAVVSFTHAEGGLSTSDGGPVRGFAIAGKDRRFVWADARIAGDTVEVTSANIPEPVAVRYGWAAYPVANLVNGGGLPASPFRTDDWPGVTAGVE